jgi:hypothetical protein
MEQSGIPLGPRSGLTRPTPNRLNWPKTWIIAGFSWRLISMKHSVGADRIEQMPSIVPNDIFSLSDDECVARLARAIERHDLKHLDEVAQLIGRLAVTIE